MVLIFFFRVNKINNFLKKREERTIYDELKNCILIYTFYRKSLNFIYIVKSDIEIF